MQIVSKWKNKKNISVYLVLKNLPRVLSFNIAYDVKSLYFTASSSQMGVLIHVSNIAPDENLFQLKIADIFISKKNVVGKKGSPKKYWYFSNFFTKKSMCYGHSLDAPYNICFYEEIKKNIPNNPSYLKLWWCGRVVWRYCVSYVTGASNWYWLTVGQGLLSTKQVRVEGECFYFFAFFPVPLSSLFFSFISSTISSISFLPFSGR